MPAALPVRADANRRPRVVVSHPGGNSMIYGLVAATQSLGRSVEFDAGFYYRAPGRLANSPWLPRPLRARLEAMLRRRFHPAIDPQGVRLFPAAEAFRQLLARLPLGRAGRRHVVPLRDNWFDRAVARRLRRTGCDLVIGHDGAFLRTLRAARQSGAVTVLNQTIGHVTAGRAILREEAELCPDFADSIPTDTPDAVLRRCTAEALEADHLLAPSDYVRDSLTALGVDRRRIVVMPYGADLELFRPAAGPEPGGFRVLFVGQIGQRKGIKYLLEAVRRLGLADLELVLAGPLVGRGAGLGPYGGLFRHVPKLPYDALPRLYRQSSIFVYPSLHEGSAMATFEALASGLPVIATPNAGSVVRDGEEGYIVPIRDVEALMERILRLYDDPTLRRSMAEKARARAEGHSWRHYRDRMDGFLRRALADR